MSLAHICRFGNQDIYKLLGRDPYKQPLSSLELALFESALYEIVEAEFSPKDNGEFLEAEDYNGEDIPDE